MHPIKEPCVGLFQIFKGDYGSFISQYILLFQITEIHLEQTILMMT